MTKNPASQSSKASEINQTSKPNDFLGELNSLANKMKQGSLIIAFFHYDIIRLKHTTIRDMCLIGLFLIGMLLFNDSIIILVWLVFVFIAVEKVYNKVARPIQERYIKEVAETLFPSDIDKDFLPEDK